MEKTVKIVIVVVALFLSGVIGYLIAPSTVIGTDNSTVNTLIDNAVKQAVDQKNTEIATLQNIITNFEDDVGPSGDNGDGEVKEFTGYVIDGLYLNSLLEDIYSDREVETLFDGEVDFDGKDYDAEETLILNDIKLLANGNDFEGDVYMTVLEGAVEYKFEFENDLNTSLINEDETLEFSFLGKEVEISDWSNDEITFTRGTEYPLDKDESVTYNEKVITLKYVVEKDAYVDVDGISEKIHLGDSEEVNGINIKVDDITYQSWVGGLQLATLIVSGSEIESVVNSGEEYEEDSIWEWKISDNSIGIILNTDFTRRDKDDDEDFPAIGEGESLCLPNDYVCIQFNGMDEEDTREFTIDEKNGFVRIRIEDGSFSSGTSEYDVVYIGSDGTNYWIYEDYDITSEKLTDIELEDTEVLLAVDSTTGSITIGDFNVNFVLNKTNAGDDDIDYLTDYGILVINPEDSIDDNEFNIFVPEERLEGSISINQKVFEVIESETETDAVNETN